MKSITRLKAHISHLTPIGLLAILVALAACIDVQSETTPGPIKATGDNKGFAVVELFTSEGCSSCPPADRLVEKIQQENPGKDIYILAYHVDYWDHQGWKDRYSMREYTDRQKRYADWLNLETIYTPQIVVNGATEYVGSNAGSVVTAINDGLSQSPTNTLTLKGQVADGRVNVAYQETAGEKGTELVLALVQKSGESNVMAGENAGRHLSHVQIVRGLHRVGINSSKAASIKLPADFSKGGWELIGMVQRGKDGKITAAARINL